jgi:hypothetical protein
MRCVQNTMWFRPLSSVRVLFVYVLVRWEMWKVIPHHCEWYYIRWFGDHATHKLLPVAVQISYDESCNAHLLESHVSTLITMRRLRKGLLHFRFPKPEREWCLAINKLGGLLARGFILKTGQKRILVVVWGPKKLRFCRCFRSGR